MSSLKKLRLCVNIESYPIVDDRHVICIQELEIEKAKIIELRNAIVSRRDTWLQRPS